ncbi:MAG: FprA family A-type flavoprotein [Candidatus Asgardarchaeia archaeon]
MTDVRTIVDGIYYVGVDDKRKYNEKQLKKFENLWPIPYGISYNSFLIVDEKPTIIDLVDEAFADELIEKVKKVIDPEKIEYIVLNHMEPDHTGAIPKFLEVAKNAKIVVSKRGIQMVMDFYDVPESRIIEAKDNMELKLGKRTLKFIMAPFLHWPETMFTYVIEDKILFTCDAFGAYGALEGKLFDDEVNLEHYLSEGKHYYSNIVSPYAMFVQRAIQRVKRENLEIKILAPSHGPIYRTDINRILEFYDKLSRWVPERKVVIIYGSMYGFTTKMVEFLKKEIEAARIPVKIYDASYSDLSDMITDALDAPVLVVGSPTYDAQIYPPVQSVMHIIRTKRFKSKPVALFGVFGWGGGALSKLKEMLEGMKFEVLEPIVGSRGNPKPETFEKLKELAKIVIQKVKELTEQ